MLGEDDQVAQPLPDPNVIGLVLEEGLGAGGRHLGQRGHRVSTGPGHRERSLGCVGGEDLDLELSTGGPDALEEKHADRVGLLAGGTTRHPHTDRPAGPCGGDQRGNHLPVELLPGVGVAEKAGHGDHQIAVQRPQFLGLGIDDRDVVGEALDAPQPLPAGDAAAQHRLPVATIVAAEPLAQHGQTHREVQVVRGRPAFRPACGRLLRVAHEAQQRGRHRTRRQNPVDHARGDGAARHRGVLGRGRILRQHGPHLLLHGLDADGGVASGTGQDDGDGALALILGQGPEEHIDRPVKARWLATRGRIQHTAADGEGSVGGNHEDPAGNDPRRLGDLDRWQGGVGRQNGGHVAGGRSVQVQDDDERHPDVRRHSIEELAERPNTARGRPDGDDRKSVAGAAYRWPSFLRHRLPRPPIGYLFDSSTRLASWLAQAAKSRPAMRLRPSKSASPK